MAEMLCPALAAQMTEALASLCRSMRVQGILHQEAGRAKMALTAKGFSVGEAAVTADGYSAAAEHAWAACEMLFPVWVNQQRSGAPDFELKVVLAVAARMEEGWRPEHVLGHLVIMRSVAISRPVQGGKVHTEVLSNVSERCEAEGHLGTPDDMVKLAWQHVAKQEDAITPAERVSAMEGVVADLVDTVEP